MATSSRTVPISRRGHFWFAVFSCVLGMAILTSLGLWQVERLQWKESLLATINSRIHGAPVPLAQIEAVQASGGDVDYRPVEVTGTFDHTGERFFLASRDGQPGWHVYTPLLISGEPKAIFVNRGFVPYEAKDPATRQPGQVSGEQVILGLARSQTPAKPGWFLPANDTSKNTFFWRDVSDMSAGLAVPEGVSVLPFFVDAGEGEAPGGFPVGGVTVVDIPNDHLQYAITWFGLDLVLAVMFVGFLVRSRKRNRLTP